MGTTFRIAEVAQRSGFTRATLRYYEELGLIEPVDRTASGYRLYDEASLERLRFIARAKQLGCRLDEIADLTAAWDGGRCATVQQRLRTAVATRLAQADDQIASLTALAADLERAAATLALDPVDGPCDDTCACTAAPAAAAPVPLVAKAHAGTETDAETGTRTGTRAVADEPIACTLGAADVATRLEEWRTLLQDVMARRRLDDGGIRLELAPTTDVTEVARLAAAERGCCAFFRFAVVIDSAGLALEVHAPPDGQPVLTALFGSTP